jgi:hypothetical protein
MAETDPSPADTADTNRSSAFARRIAYLLNSLQREGVISPIADGYYCSLCKQTVSKLHDLSMHCWMAHRTYLPPAARPLLLYLFPDSPLTFPDNFLASPHAEHPSTYFIPSDFQESTIISKTPASVFPFVLSVLTGSPVLPPPKDPFLLRLPFPFSDIEFH